MNAKQVAEAAPLKKFDFVAAHFQCERNRYSPENPGGYVNFGSAQNFLHPQRLSERFGNLPYQDEDFAYQLFTGTEQCRTSIAEHLESLAGVPVNASDVVVGNGIISLLEALTMALLKPGERIMIPTPVFPGLVTSIKRSERFEITWLHAQPSEQFRISPQQFEAALNEAAAKGQPVKAILLCSPGNPIGQVFAPSELDTIIEIAERFDCALIVDEVYSLSCFPHVSFTSAISAKSQHVFVLGGLSKDFGLAGYATGWIHGTHPRVMDDVKAQSHFYRLPSPVQRVIQSALEPNWKTGYVTNHQQHLGQAYQNVSSKLQELGVKVTSAEAGLCLWLDLRDQMRSPDRESEMLIYQTLLDEHRVHVSPGSGFYTPHFGFFRICFSQNDDTLNEGVSRIASGLSKIMAC